MNYDICQGGNSYYISNTHNVYLIHIYLYLIQIHSYAKSYTLLVLYYHAIYYLF